MNIQLHSIDRAPADVPFWQTLDGLCQPSPSELAELPAAQTSRAQACA